MVANFTLLTSCYTTEYKLFASNFCIKWPIVGWCAIKQINQTKSNSVHLSLSLFKALYLSLFIYIYIYISLFTSLFLLVSLSLSKSHLTPSIKKKNACFLRICLKYNYNYFQKYNESKVMIIMKHLQLNQMTYKGLICL